MPKLFKNSKKSDSAPEKKPEKKMSKKELDIILYGSDEPIRYEIHSSGGTTYTKNQYIEGVKTLIERRYEETTSKMSKEWYYSYMVESTCTVCNGARLNEKVLAVRVGDKNINEFTKMSIKEANNITISC